MEVGHIRKLVILGNQSCTEVGRSYVEIGRIWKLVTIGNLAYGEVGQKVNSVLFDLLWFRSKL